MICHTSKGMWSISDTLATWDEWDMQWYQCDIRGVSVEDYEKYFHLMSEEKQQRIRRFRSVKDRKRSIAGEMLARRAISDWCAVAEENIIFDTNQYGKPFAAGLPIEFSISHSGNLAVCAVDHYPVGIDIERIRPVDFRIARHIFTQEELVYLFRHVPQESDFAQVPDEITMIRFFELWTAKEAYCKCYGVGLAASEGIKKCSPASTIVKRIQKHYVLSLCSVSNQIQNNSFGE